MALTGPAGAPPIGPPRELPERLDRIADRIAVGSGSIGREVVLDPLATLTERAALTGLHRQGAISCGGSCRLLQASDGWIALTIARPSDVQMIPAWLGIELSDACGLQGHSEAARLWSGVEEGVRGRDVASLEARAALLGLAVGALFSRSEESEMGEPVGLPVTASSLGGAPARLLDGLVVVDLSSLWAGPLCGRILADAGATVVKVESEHRPDGARLGPCEFFDLLNAGKASVSLDITTCAGRDALQRLLSGADAVIESSRPRALEQLGIDADEVVRSGPQVWVAITGHGRAEGRDRVAFGDDAAIAGGLASWSGEQPMFCADAVADPCAGLTAAAAALEALASGGRWILDVSMTEVSAHLAGPTLDGRGIVAPAPRVPASRGTARPIGADNGQMLPCLLARR